MKVSTKKYAEILYALIKNKKEAEIKPVVKDFAEFLVANKDTGKLGLIMEKFSSLWNTNQSITEAELLSARKLDEEIVANLKKYLAGITGVKQVIFKEKIDKTILGGVVISYRDKVIDGSLRTKIKQLRDNMVK